MKFKLFVVIFFGSLVLVTELLADNVDRKIQIVFDPDSIKNESIAPAWFGYIMGRAVYIGKHQDVYKKQHGESKPSGAFQFYPQAA